MQRSAPAADSEAGLLTDRYLCLPLWSVLERILVFGAHYRRVHVLCLSEDHGKPTQSATCTSRKQDIRRILCNSADSCGMCQQQLQLYAHCYGCED